jgi:predicted DNA-binding antitoxin AbrB/MazE fold protein
MMNVRWAMSEIVTAVYENGVLRPTEPLKLREHQRVLLQVLPEDSDEDVRQLIQHLVAAGLMRSPITPSGSPPPDPVTEEERRRLADKMGRAPGKPLSDIILEERGKR